MQTKTKKLLAYSWEFLLLHKDSYIEKYVNLTGDKRYELSNHLGNVLVVINDKKIPEFEKVDTPSSGLVAFNADVLSYSDYYPFGMLQEARHGSKANYRYGFNGKEKDDELKGEGNNINYEARMHDPRVGRFLSIDPLTKQFPSLTPYQFASNDPIESIDLDGQERYDYRWVKDNKGNSNLKLIGKTDIVDRIVVGYTSGRSFGNDAPMPTYETRTNQRQEFIVHTDWEVYLDNNGGLNMDRPQRKEIFDVRTFYKSKSNAVADINGSQSISDRLKIARAIHANSMGPENAALPALGAGNLRRVAAVEKGVLATERGALRAAQFSAEWENASLKSVINKFAPGVEGVETTTGKTLYTNSKTGIRVVEDKAGKYFRIEDTNVSGKRSYLDLDGNTPNNKIINGKTSGRSQAEYNQVTHFNNTDN